MVEDGLLVKVNETAVFGRVGLVWRVVFILMFRFRVSLLESNTSPSPISRPERKSSLTSARFAACFSLDWWSGERSCCLLLRMSSKWMGPAGRTSPSRPSSSLSMVSELATLGLNAETEELLLERPSLRVPPKRVPRLPSPHSSNSSCTLTGVLGISYRAESLRGPPSEGS